MKPPAFQFYPNDFVSGTRTLNTEEIGAYILLLCHQWNAGYVPDDETLIRRIAGLTQAFPLGLVLSKFEKVDGVLKNARLERERAKQSQFRDKQAANGRKGGRPKGLDNPSLSQPERVGLANTEPKKSSSSSSSDFISIPPVVPPDGGTSEGAEVTGEASEVGASKEIVSCSLGNGQIPVDDAPPSPGAVTSPSGTQKSAGTVPIPTPPVMVTEEVARGWFEQWVAGGASFTEADFAETWRLLHSTRDVRTGCWRVGKSGMVSDPRPILEQRLHDAMERRLHRNFGAPDRPRGPASQAFVLRLQIGVLENELAAHKGNPGGLYEDSVKTMYLDEWRAKRRELDELKSQLASVNEPVAA